MPDIAGKGLLGMKQSRTEGGIDFRSEILKWD